MSSSMHVHRARNAVEESISTEDDASNTSEIRETDLVYDDLEKQILDSPQRNKGNPKSSSTRRLPTRSRYLSEKQHGALVSLDGSIATSRDGGTVSHLISGEDEPICTSNWYVDLPEELLPPRKLKFRSQVRFNRSREVLSMCITFRPYDQLFDVVMEGQSKVPMCLCIVNKEDQPLEPFDVFVGAKIDICGRSTTLSLATPNTVAWLDKVARFLYGRIEKLIVEVSKYQMLPDLNPHLGPTVKVLKKAGSKEVLGGQIDLRRLIIVNSWLLGQLAIYREDMLDSF